MYRALLLAWVYVCVCCVTERVRDNGHIHQHTRNNTLYSGLPHIHIQWKWIRENQNKNSNGDAQNIYHRGHLRDAIRFPIGKSLIYQYQFVCPWKWSRIEIRNSNSQHQKPNIMIRTVTKNTFTIYVCKTWFTRRRRRWRWRCVDVRCGVLAGPKENQPRRPFQVRARAILFRGKHFSIYNWSQNTRSECGQCLQRIFTHKFWFLFLLYFPREWPTRARRQRW